MAAIETKPGDEELVKSAQNGNTRAFERLVERYFGMVYAIAYGRLGNREATEDLAQEVFLRTYLYLGNVQEPHRFAGWLVRVTHNLANNWVRRRQRASKLCPMVSLDQVEQELPDKNGDDAREKMDLEEQNRALHEAIFQLPTDQREIVLLHFTEGLSKKEIATCLGVHPSTVGRHLKRALAAMKGSLEPILRESAPSLRATKKAVNRTLVLVGALAGMSTGGKAAIAAAAGGTAWLSSVSLPAAGSLAVSKVVPSALKTIASITNKGMKLMIARKVMVTTIIVAGLITGGAILHVRNIQRAEKSPKQEDSVPTAVKVKDERPSHPTRDDDEDVIKPEEDKEPVEETGYSISGQVVDEDGQGMAEAEVAVCLGSSGEVDRNAVRRVITDAGGRFAVSDLPRRTLFLTAAKEQHLYYTPGLLHWVSAAAYYPVYYHPEEDGVTGILLVMHLGATLGGTVVDEEDRPIANARVRICRSSLGTPTVLDVELKTDSEGRFQTTSLVPGRYWVRVQAEGFLLLAQDSLIGTGGDDLVLRLKRSQAVEGIVVLEESGEPVPNARVRGYGGYVRWIDATEASTDADGRFTIVVDPDATTRLHAFQGDLVTLRPFTVRPDNMDQTGDIVLKLQKGGSVSGIVCKHATGDAVEGVLVTTGRHGEALSDGEGRFIIRGLVPTSYSIWINSNEYSLLERQQVEVNADIETVGVRLEVVRRITYSLSGIVVDTDGRPVFGASLHPFAKRSFAAGKEAISDADGRFVAMLRKPKETTGLLVRHGDFCYTTVDLVGRDLSQGMEGMRVVLQKSGGSIEGFVYDNEGEPKDQVVVSLRTRRLGNWNNLTLKTTITDEMGHYFFGSVSVGAYFVRAQLARRSVLSSEVEVRKEEKISDVNLVVLPAGYISGRVTDDSGSPVKRIRVFAKRGRHHHTQKTDSEGRFLFKNLDEGENYVVQVNVKENPDYEYKGDEFNKREVKCSTEGVDFIVARTTYGSIRGFVSRESDGNPVTRFRVNIWNPSTPAIDVGRNREFESDDGSFHYRSVLTGKCRIEINAEGFPKFTKPLVVKEDQETTEIILLSDNGTVRGSVSRKSDGTPVKKFYLSLIPESREIETVYRNREYESDSGSFLCEIVLPGRYSLTIIAQGLPDFKTEPFDVRANDETFLEVEIGEGGVVQGRVVNEDGHGVHNVDVQVLSGKHRHRLVRGKPEFLQKATTDKIGGFVISNLAPGEITLKAIHPDYAELIASRIKVTEDAETDDVVLRLEKGTLVYGQVKGSDGKGAFRLGIDLYGVGNRYWSSTSTDSEGQYSFDHVPKGKYYLSIKFPAASTSLFNTEGEEEREVDIDLTERGEISGTLYLPSRRDELDVSITVYRHDNKTGWRFGWGKNVKVGEDNSFRIENLLPGMYVFHVSGYRIYDDDTKKRVSFTTSPKRIIVNISPEEELIKDITVIEISEPD